MPLSVGATQGMAASSAQLALSICSLHATGPATVNGTLASS